MLMKLISLSQFYALMAYFCFEFFIATRSVKCSAVEFRAVGLVTGAVVTCK